MRVWNSLFKQPNQLHCLVLCLTYAGVLLHIQAADAKLVASRTSEQLQSTQQQLQQLQQQIQQLNVKHAQLLTSYSQLQAAHSALQERLAATSAANKRSTLQLKTDKAALQEQVKQLQEVRSKAPTARTARRKMDSWHACLQIMCMPPGVMCMWHCRQTPAVVVTGAWQ